MIQEYVRFAIKTFRASQARTWLTMIGIFIGIAAVVSLVSLGQGLQEAINEQFQQMGTDKIMISPGSSILSGLGTGLATEIRDSDLDVVKKVSGVKQATGWLYKLGRVEYNKKIKYFWIIGLPLDPDSLRVIKSINSINVAEGRDLKTGDTYKAGIGYLLANSDAYFGEKISVGSKIKVESQEFKVINSMERIGNEQDDTNIYIPIKAARTLLDMPSEYSMILAQVQPGKDIQAAAKEIEDRLRKHRNVKEGEEDFTVQTTEDLLRTFKTIFNLVQAVIIGIAAISLIVGGIGIMNTMYTSVLERTNEIGLMKAIGAANKDIMMIFMIESGMLGMAGGSIGIIIGIGFSKLVEFGAAQANTPLLKASFPWYLILGALAFSFIVGTIFGTLPAIQASRLKPVDALRYE